MAKRGRKPSLVKLEEQRKVLNDRIKSAKRDERKAVVELERERYAIIGRAIAKELAENHDLAAQMEPIINARVTRAVDRKFLGLEPLPKKSTSSASSS